MSASRIVVLGCAGVGKTRLSRALAARIEAPHVCLDEMWPGRLKPEAVPAFRRLVAETHAGEAWVSDGNFAEVSFDLRLPRADLVLWLERPRWRCMVNAVRRLSEPGQTHGWRGLPDVLAFISRFDRVNRPKIERGLADHAAHSPPRRLRSPADEAELIAELGP